VERVDAGHRRQVRGQLRRQLDAAADADLSVGGV
jgi:hypothetical protein